jgi:hypothetical protein
MLGALYVAFGILLIRGANDPRRNVALFDFGILSSILHGLVMVPQSFIYPNEHAHMWSDVPFIFLMAVVLWIWHPNRVKGQNHPVGDLSKTDACQRCRNSTYHAPATKKIRRSPERGPAFFVPAN